MAKLKFTFPQLAVIDWLCEAGGGETRILNSHSSLTGSRGLYFFESVPGPDGRMAVERVWPSHGKTAAEDAAFLDRFGGRDTIDIHALYKAGFTKSLHCLGFHRHDQDQGRKEYADVVARLDHNPFHPQSGITVPTEKALEYWRTEGRDLLVAARAERARQQEAVSRTVLIGKKCRLEASLPKEMLAKLPAGVRFPLPGVNVMRPYAMARVVKVTDTRVYLRDVKMLPGVGGEDEYRDSPIGGNEPNRYVALDRVMLDNASAKDCETLVGLHREYAGRIQRTGERYAERMLPIIAEMHAGALQNEAEHADAVRELLGGRTLNVGDKPKPVAPDDDDEAYGGPSGP